LASKKKLYKYRPKDELKVETQRTRRRTRAEPCDPAKEDTIVITYYNAPNVERLREHYEGLPGRLQSEHIDPQVPWLYGFKLDFRFR